MPPVFHTVIVIAFGFASASVHADIITISGTGQFDSSLGTLNSATVTFDPPSIGSFSSGSTSHQFDPSPFTVPFSPGTVIDLNPFSVTANGFHSHFVDTPLFSWNGLTVDLPNFSSGTDGNHLHQIDFAPTVVGSGGVLNLAATISTTQGSHAHSINPPTFDTVFSGSDLDVFLTGTPTASVDIPTFSSAPSGVHSHTITPGNYSAIINGSSSSVFFPNVIQSTFSSPHSHVIDFPTFSVTSTTFEFTPVPEPTSLSLAAFVALTIACTRSRRRSHKRKTIIVPPAR